MYKVEVYHYRKAWRNGDLEAEQVMIGSEFFSTRKSAKEYIERQVESNAKYADKPFIRREYHKGDKPSYIYLWTGEEWQHENSGETCQEYYTYTLRRARAK